MQEAPWAHELRKRAEEIISDRLANFEIEDMKEIIYELQVHQLVLEIQNDELRVTEHKLENLNEHYKQLHNLLPVGVFTLDIDSQIVDLNQTAATMLGGYPDQFIGKNFTSFI